MKISSYSKIYNLGSNELVNGPQNLLEGIVTIEEKIDCSQISFSVDDNGNISVKSKETELDIEKPEKMFGKAVEVIKKLPMKPNWIYRGEYLQKPKHNALAYDRAPDRSIILYDVEIEPNVFMYYENKVMEAERIGLEVVPLLYKGKGELVDGPFLKSLLDKTSVLGGAKIEGVVIKNYALRSRDDKVLMGKYVSDGFKEVHRHKFKENTSSKDLILTLIETFKSKARWQKAILHLQEKGLLVNDMKDIGLLIKEIHSDVEKECLDDIKEMCWNGIRAQLMKGIVNGFPDYYKEKLIENQTDLLKEKNEKEAM